MLKEILFLESRDFSPTKYLRFLLYAQQDTGAAEHIFHKGGPTYM